MMVIAKDWPMENLRASVLQGSKEFIAKKISDPALLETLAKTAGNAPTWDWTTNVAAHPVSSGKAVKMTSDLALLVTHAYMMAHVFTRVQALRANVKSGSVVTPVA